MAAILLSGIALVVASIVRSDLNVLQNSLSYYAIGPWGALQSTAFIALGVSSISLALALRSAISPSLANALCSLLLIVAGVSCIFLVIFPMGSTGPGTILGDAHQTAGTIAGVAQLTATLAFVVAIRAERAWYRIIRVARVALAVAIFGAVVTQAAIWWPNLDLPMGAAMRLVALPLLALWGLVAFRLSRFSVTLPTQFVAATRSHPYSFRRG